MHKLARQVRFSINPFGAAETAGHNSFASNPPGEGLCIYFSLWVEIIGDINAETGFLVNVVEIDKAVRKYAVGIIGDYVKKNFEAKNAVFFADIAVLLRKVWGKLKGKFGAAKITALRLELNPFRKISIENDIGAEMIISEKFEFAATHTLWNDKFSNEKNLEIFGKCANPTGHGHNYVVEVAVKVENNWMGMGEFERIVEENLISVVDHKNLNIDVAEFAKTIPTVENIAVFAWKKLVGELDGLLDCINVWETDKTYCSYRGG